jgi:PKD repeat protein
MNLDRCHFLSCLFFIGFALPGGATDASYFSHPPGTEWGVLLRSHASAWSVAAIPGGYAVAGNSSAEAGAPGIDSWGVLALLGTDGTVTGITDFSTETDCNWIEEIAPRYAGDGSLAGFAFAGFKWVFGSDDGHDWHVPWMWAAKTDAAQSATWQGTFGTRTHQTEGHAVLWDGAELLVGGSDHSALSTFAAEWLVRLDSGGVKTREVSFSSTDHGGVFAIAPAGDGGYVLGTSHGVVKVNADLELQWRSGDSHDMEGYGPDRYKDVAVAGNGNIYAVGHRSYSSIGFLHPGLLVVAMFAPDGTMLWRKTVGTPGDGSEVNAPGGIVVLPGGGCVATGSAPAGIHGGSDMRVLKFRADGSLDWDLMLGGEGSDSASDVVLAPDGGLIVVGHADVAGEQRMWVVKVRNDLHAPEPDFSMAPPSPLFHGQEAAFDSSASTAPGSAITWRHWDFGDGTTVDGEITPTHTFVSSGVYQVELTLENSDGIRRSVVHEVEVVGLQVQWERYIGRTQDDTAAGLVEARDGGFVLTGTFSDRLWVCKTDGRGRSVWEHFIGREDGDGSQEGHSIIQAHDTGYIVAGQDYHYTHEFHRRQDAWLLKFGEDGELAWPEIRVFGEPSLHEVARCVAPAADGGYIVLGHKTILPDSSDGYYPWLVKTDADGVEEWSRHYGPDHPGLGNWVVQAPDGGFAFVASKSGVPFNVVKTDALGELLWASPFNQYNRGNWIGLRNPPEDGFAVVGVVNKNIGLQFLGPDGSASAAHSWTGAVGKNWIDTGHHAVRTPDGGFLIVGTALRKREDHTSPNYELSLVKTDAAGNTHWMDFFPGTEQIHEEGIAGLVLADGSYVILGSRQVPDSKIWLFKLAANLPPVAGFETNPARGQIGQRIFLDGTPSSDPDGEVVAWEWRFDDGSAPLAGVAADHVFAEAGVHEITLTAVDDRDAENSIVKSVVISGVKGGDSNMVMEAAEAVPDPGSDREHFPRSGSVPGLVWENSRGFFMDLDATSSTDRSFRITYTDPLPEHFKLFRLPDWVETPYTIIDEHTLEIRLWISRGKTSLAFVLSLVNPIGPRVIVSTTSNPWLLALHFGTVDGAEYQVERTLDLDADDWAPEAHSTDFDRLPNQQILTGDGENAAIYVNRPHSPDAFFRLRITEPPETP